MHSFYSYIQVIHIVSMISWMAALLYLPRLFVYHTEKNTTLPTQQIFQVMERKLLFYIATPAMLVTLITGLTLAFMFGFVEGWLHAKILLVLLLIAYHHYLYFCRRKLINNPHWKSSRFFRILNEVPTILMILIVLLVVVRPF